MAFSMSWRRWLMLQRSTGSMLFTNKFIGLTTCRLHVVAQHTQRGDCSPSSPPRTLSWLGSHSALLLWAGDSRSLPLDIKLVQDSQPGTRLPTFSRSRPPGATSTALSAHTRRGKSPRTTGSSSSPFGQSASLATAPTHLPANASRAGDDEKTYEDSIEAYKETPMFNVVGKLKRRREVRRKKKALRRSNRSLRSHYDVRLCLTIRWTALLTMRSWLEQDCSSGASDTSSISASHGSPPRSRAAYSDEDDTQISNWAKMVAASDVDAPLQQKRSKRCCDLYHSAVSSSLRALG